MYSPAVHCEHGRDTIALTVVSVVATPDTKSVAANIPAAIHLPNFDIGTLLSRIPYDDQTISLIGASALNLNAGWNRIRLSRCINADKFTTNTRNMQLSEDKE